MSHTDRLGGVVPGDVVVKVGVVRHAVDLEFLPNNTHIFIHLQEDIWREPEFWNEMNKMSSKKKKYLVIQRSEPTLYDVDGKGLGCLLDPFDLGRADIVGIEARLEAADENSTVSVNCVVHFRGHGGAIVHAQAQVCGFWVRQQAGQQVILTLLLHHSQSCAAGPEHTVWV